MTYQRPPKKIRLFLIFLIILLIGFLLIPFVKNRVRVTRTVPPPSPETTDADLTIKRFHHTATRHGERQWSLEAESASLHSKQNQAQLFDILATFYLKGGQTILLNADKGILNTQTNDMTATGHIKIQTPEYTLETQSLHCDHRSHIIETIAPATITGAGIVLKADTMAYNLETGVITCAGHVEGSIREAAQK